MYVSLYGYINMIILIFFICRKFKDKVFDVLRVLEMNGGDDALKEIKKKIPTYVTSI